MPIATLEGKLANGTDLKNQVTSVKDVSHQTNVSPVFAFPSCWRTSTMAVRLRPLVPSLYSPTSLWNTVENVVIELIKLKVNKEECHRVNSSRKSENESCRLQCLLRCRIAAPLISITTYYQLVYALWQGESSGTSQTLLTEFSFKPWIVELHVYH